MCLVTVLDMMLVGGRRLFAVNYRNKEVPTAYNHRVIIISSIGYFLDCSIKIIFKCTRFNFDFFLPCSNSLKTYLLFRLDQINSFRITALNELFLTSLCQ